jgi:hypothetical protein
VKDALRELAQEELGHRPALERMLLSPGQVRRSVRKIQQAPSRTTRSATTWWPSPWAPIRRFQDVCIFASKKEQKVPRALPGLAEENEGEIRDLFEAMAKDELRHKNLVESWYEEVIYKDF